MNRLRAAACVVLLAAVALPGCGSAPDAAVPGDALAAAQGVTEAQARQLVEAVEAAAVAKDPVAQTAHFAADATITTVIPNPDPSGADREIVRTRDEYIAAELQSHADSPVSAYSSRIDDIRIAADGASAQVRVLAEQSMQLDGRDARMTADQELTVELRDGRPVVVAVRSTLTGMTLDGKAVP
jgi:hypothetical protein